MTIRRNRPIYVIDTNILVDYPEIIPAISDGWHDLREPTVDLSQAHIVIPTAVIRELSSFKREKSERGKVARTVLKRLRALTELEVHDGMRRAYHLQTPIELENGPLVSVLPVHKDFKRHLPFSPAEDDMDGQIILAALTLIFLSSGLELTASMDGRVTTEDFEKALTREPNSVTILTNDNGLAVRANVRGVRTSRYSYRVPAPYTGRRDVEIPSDLLHHFLEFKEAGRDYWELFMENEQPLVANEFIVMKPVAGCDYPDGYTPQDDPYFRYIGRYNAEQGAIVPLKYVGDFPLKLNNAGQAIYAEALMDPQYAAVICTGPAGSGKTYMATVYGYTACLAGKYIGVTVVPCESQSRIGALPGDLNEKMDPDTQPLKNALRNYLLTADRDMRKELRLLQASETRMKISIIIGEDDENDEQDQRSLKQKLADRIDSIWAQWFSNIPIEHARGRDFAHEIALYDEFQDQNQAQADTLVKRLGANGKIVLTGDYEQIHAPYLDASNNGLAYASRLLYDLPMVAQVHFTADEVIRHPLVKMVAERQRAEAALHIHTS